MAEICHLENRHDVIFSAEGGLIWIQFWRLVQNDMSTAVIWSKWKPDVEFQYGECLGEFHGMLSQSHLPDCRVLPLGEFSAMIPELCVTLQGAATGRSQRHVIPEPHITLQGDASWWIHLSWFQSHIAGCSHLAKSMSWSCHIAGCNNSIRHNENRFSHIILYFILLMQFGLWRAAAFISSLIHLFYFAWVRCHCQCSQLPGKIRLRNDLLTWVTCDITPCITHFLTFDCYVPDYSFPHFFGNSQPNTNHQTLWDWPSVWLANHHPSVLWLFRLNHLTHKIVSEMTCNVSSGTLNANISYHTQF